MTNENPPSKVEATGGVEEGGNLPRDEAGILSAVVHEVLESPDLGIPNRTEEAMGFDEGATNISKKELEIIKLPSSVVSYKSKSGAVILIDDGKYDGSGSFVSLDGEIFYEIYRGGFSSGTEVYAYSFLGAADQNSKNFEISKDRKTASLGNLDGFEATEEGIPSQVVDREGAREAVNTNMFSVELFKKDNENAVLIYKENIYLRNGDDFTFVEIIDKNSVDIGGCIFENPHTGQKGELKIIGKEVSLGEITFHETDTPQNINAIKIPEVRVPVYSFSLSDGKSLTVTTEKYNKSDEAYRLFIDNREVPISRIDRYRDGGTTFIRTEEGTLYIPVKNRFKYSYRNDAGEETQEKPTWNGEEISENEK